MKSILFFCLVILILLVHPAAAVIQVNASNIGCTYIQWNWTPGLNLTDMYIDGNVMCGYETTSPYYLATGLQPGEPHIIQVITASDSGTNSTVTLSENCTGIVSAVISNKSYTAANQSPLMTTETVWILFAFLGIGLLLISAAGIAPIVEDLSGILASLFLLISAIQSFAVDTVTGYGMVYSGFKYALMEHHTIYHYDFIGVAIAVVFVLSLGNLYRIWLSHKRITKQEQEKTKPDLRGSPPRSQEKDDDSEE